MSIIRVRKHAQFVSIDMSVLADLSLSWEAKGLNVYLLSRVDHWQVSVAHLARSNPHAGRDKIYRMWRQLIEHGYRCRESSSHRHEPIGLGSGIFSDDAFSQRKSENMVQPLANLLRGVVSAALFDSPH